MAWPVTVDRRPYFGPQQLWHDKQTYETETFRQVILKQLPTTVRARLRVGKLLADPYFLAAHVTLVHTDGREFETKLEPMKWAGDKNWALKIPDVFLVKLCLLV